MSQDAKSPRYSLLIVGYRSLAYLPDCLGSVLRSAEPPDFEVLFLDNGSPEPEGDWAEAHVRDARLRVFRSDRNLFFAGGVNHLAARARGEFLVLLNPDTRVEPDWLERLDACLREAGADAAQADLRSHAEPGTRETAGYFLDRLGLIAHAPAAAGPEPIFGGRGAGLAVKARVFHEAGGMDEDYKMYFEETDLCWRINLLGYRIVQAPGAVVYHVSGGSSRRGFFPWNHFRFVRNRISALIKNYETASLLTWLPLHLLLCALSAARHLLRLRAGMALAEAAALAAPWPALPSTLRKRRSVQASRRVSERELILGGLMLPGFKGLGRAPRRG